MQPRKEHYRNKLPHFQQPGQQYMVTCVLKGAIPKGALDNYAVRLETARNRLKELEKSVFRESLSWESEFPNSDKTFDLGKSKSRESEFPNSDKEHSELGNSESHKSKSRLEEARKEYQIALRKYRLAYEKVLNKTAFNGINLVKNENLKVIEEALLYWENKRLKNHAWCIMPNHLHWIFTVLEKEARAGVSNSDKEKPQSFSSTLESRTHGESDFPKSDNNSDRKVSELGNSESKGKAVYLQDILHSVKLFTARRINENENSSGQLWEHESFDTTIRNNQHFVNAINYVLNNPVKAGFVKDWKDWPGTRIFGSWIF